MSAIFVIPVHCTNPVELLYAENLWENNKRKNDEFRFWITINKVKLQNKG